MKIGIYLRKYRVNNGYSQECVADILGVSQKTYSNMENDRSHISFETIQKLIELYAIDISKLDIQKFITEGKLVEHNLEINSQKPGVATNKISEKLIAQMEERIHELKTRIVELASKR